MRVALLTNFIPPYRRSLYQAIAAQAGELRVFVSTPMENGRPWIPNWSGLDVVVQRTLTVNRTWGNADFRERYQMHFPYDTLLQLRRWSPDVIIAGEMGARSAQALLYGSLTRTPVVLWATVSDRLETARAPALHAFRRRMLRRAGAVIVNGEGGARYIKQLGVGEDRVLRVPYTTDMTALFQIPFAASELQLLYIGSISERKGVHRFLDGAAAFARTHPSRMIKLILVGDGPMRPSLQQRSMPDNVSLQWIGGVAYEDLPTWFAKGSVVVFPTLGDEWGVVVNEALAAGLPVLGSTYSQAVEELIRDGQNGWLFAPDSQTDIAAALERVYDTTPGVLARMREQARATARQLEPHAAAQKIVARLAELTHA